MAAKILITAICLILPAFAAGAGPDRLSFMIGSHHFNARDDYVEVNPGVFLTWDDPWDVRLGVTAGAYRNSYGKLAESAQILYPVANWPKGQLEIFGGIAHYPGDGDKVRVHIGDLIPVAGLSARWSNAFAIMIPCFCAGFDVVVAGGLTFPLGHGG